ncbi:MAG: hypothetical protein JEZ00_14105 [Anaerolineaceae bacterium]|nr:hypothetical protein [Anaerolineaceae bacterium]
MIKIKEYKTWPVILLVILGIFALLAIGLLVYWYYTHPPLPTVTVLQPDDRTILTSGDGLMIISESQSDAGIQRLEFYVDDIYQSQQENPKTWTESFQVAFPWFASQVGVHKLSVVAYDVQGRASLPDSIIVGVKSVYSAQVIPSTEQEINGDNQGDEEVYQQGEGDTETQAVQVAFASESNQVIGGGEVFQAADIRVDHASDEQIQIAVDDANMDDNFPQEIPDNPQDFAPILRVTSTTERQGAGIVVSLHVFAEDDFGLDSLQMIYKIPGEDWGDDSFALGGNLFYETSDHLFFESGELSFFFQVFDTSGQASQPVSLSFQVIPGEGDDAPAIVMDDEFNPDDIEVFDGGGEQDEPQEQVFQDDFGTPIISDYPCFGLGVELEVPYKYVTNHGAQVYAAAFAVKDGELLAAGNAPVELSSDGIVRFTMQKREDIESVNTSDSLYLELRTPDPNHPNNAYYGERFYRETVDFPINWVRSLPELVITRVTRSTSGRDLEIDVQNQGCAPVDGFSLQTHTNTGEIDWSGRFVDSVPAGETTTITIRDLDPNLYSWAFDVEIDPENVIQEIDEQNNVYQKLPIRVKYVHIYQIDIHDTSDGEWHQDSDKGEFRIKLGVNDVHTVRPVGTVGSTWNLSRGSHSFDTSQGGPVYLYPQVNPNIALAIFVEVTEMDDIGSDDQQYFVFVHPSSFNEPQNWKLGQERSYSVTSENGKYTLHWYIVLEEDR